MYSFEIANSVKYHSIYILIPLRLSKLSSHLKQCVEFSLKYLPSLGVLCRNLQGKSHRLPGEAFVQGDQSAVHPTLDQVACIVLR